MKPAIFHQTRNSAMELQKVYFWTNTIKDWQLLLKRDEYKLIIISQLQWLVSNSLIKIYGFVIMPNHMHIIWEMLQLNGKEMPQASFNKWTSSQFLKSLRSKHPNVVPFFKEETSDRKHRFWQRDALAIEVDSRAKLEQKLDYIHLNPLQEKWSLVTQPQLYKWSSAEFYESGEDKYGMLSHYMDRF